jgi:hypothetical protein
MMARNACFNPAGLTAGGQSRGSGNTRIATQETNRQAVGETDLMVEKNVIRQP